MNLDQILIVVISFFVLVTVVLLILLVKNQKTIYQLKESYDSFKYTINDIRVFNKEIYDKTSNIEFSQLNLKQINDNVIELKNIFNNKKYRGQIGEVELYGILESCFGNNFKMFQKQYKMHNDTIVDAIVFTNSKLGNIVIDSKFPLENYLKFNKNREFLNNFKADILKYIKTIEEKYLSKQDNVAYGLIFIPSDTIFNDIIENFQDLLYFSNNKKIFILGPTMLPIFLVSLKQLLINTKKSNLTNKMIGELSKLADDYRRFELRYDSIVKDFKRIEENFYELSISVNKIKKHFNKINNLDFEVENE